MNGTEEHQPCSWLLVFHTSTSLPRLDRWLPGRFKHVSAIGYVDEGDVWLIYDVHHLGTAVRAVIGDAGRLLAARVLSANGVLRVPVRRDRCLLPRLAFWCVPAMKHLVGSRSGALRPDALWRDLVRDGAEIIRDVQSESGPEPAHCRGAGGG
jgi:hypothetical protein